MGRMSDLDITLREAARLFTPATGEMTLGPTYKVERVGPCSFRAVGPPLETPPDDDEADLTQPTEAPCRKS
jgi:hypothetical protein